MKKRVLRRIRFSEVEAESCHAKAENVQVEHQYQLVMVIGDS